MQGLDGCNVTHHPWGPGEGGWQPAGRGHRGHLGGAEHAVFATEAPPVATAPRPSVITCTEQIRRPCVLLLRFFLSEATCLP